MNNQKPPLRNPTQPPMQSSQSIKTVLGDFQLDNLAVMHIGRRLNVNELEFSKSVIVAVLQSTEIQQMQKNAELLNVAVQMLADWCVAVKENGTGWDDWDEHYKDAAYRDNPLRSLIDAAMEVKP